MLELTHMIVMIILLGILDIIILCICLYYAIQALRFHQIYKKIKDIPMEYWEAIAKGTDEFENRMKTKIEKYFLSREHNATVYVPIKKALLSYFDEIEKISKLQQGNISDTSLNQLLQKLQHESALLVIRSDDFKLLVDMKILREFTEVILYGSNKHYKADELLPVINEIITRIEYKLRDPDIIYANHSVLDLDEWWTHWQTKRKGVPFKEELADNIVRNRSD